MNNIQNQKSEFAVPIKCYTCLENTSNAENGDGFCNKHSTRGKSYKIDLCAGKGQHICSRSLDEHYKKGEIK